MDDAVRVQNLDVYRTRATKLRRSLLDFMDKVTNHMKNTADSADGAWHVAYILYENMKEQDAIFSGMKGKTVGEVIV
jgi:hypothetical protein